MSFAGRVTLVVLAAFFLTSAAGALVAIVASRTGRGSLLARLTPGAIAGLRLLPSAAAAAVTAFVLAPGYYRYEQRTDLESPGVMLLLLACGGLAIFSASAWRVARSFARAASLRRAWMSGARHVDLGAGMPAFSLNLPFPLVAVLGAMRPRLFISDAVLRACSARELTAIVEHERAHVCRRDNIIRLLMEASPDLLACSRFNDRLVAAWHRAVEQRADDAASVKLDLASALVRVARLASTASPLVLPASALYRGEGADSIEARVKRLAGMAPGPGVTRLPWRTALVVAATALAAASASAGVQAHALLEVLVSRLP